MRHHILVAFSLLAVLLGGCSLINAPDRDLLSDGGVDSSMDSMVDGRVDGDAGDADTGIDTGCENIPEHCGDGDDNNCNFLVDCADPQCAAQEQCCDPTAAGDPVRWTFTELLGWERLPTGGSMTPPVDNDRELIDFPEGVQGILRLECVPLAAGYRLQTSFQMTSATCPEGDGCFVAIVLTPAPGAGPGARITDDLGVTVDQTGTFTITNDGDVLAQEVGFAGVDHVVNVVIAVTVGLDEGDSPSLLGTVTLENGNTMRSVTPLTAYAFAPLDRLIIDDATCADVGGLRLAIEGSGSQFSVHPMTYSPLECTNAGKFDVPDEGDDLLSSGNGMLMRTRSLDWGEWAAGGIGSPALGVAADGGRWHVMGDATNYDRGEDPFVELGFGIGYSAASNWNLTWSSQSQALAKTGPCNPACTSLDPDGCTMTELSMCLPGGGPPAHSVRDPSMGVQAIPSGGSIQVAYARRLGVDRYGIAVDSGFEIGMASGNQPERDARFEPGMAPPFDMCTSLRDPVLVPVDPNDAGNDNQWLFYSCFQSLEVADIHVIEVDRDLVYEDGSHRVVVDRGTVGEWGSTSVWSPELVVDYEPSGGRGRHLYRLWFLGRNAMRDRVSVGLLQGQVDPDASTELPSFAPFGANPVLRDGDVPDCPDCFIEGLAVARDPGENKIRFLIALQDEVGVEEDWHYAPFEQFWKAPLWP